MNVRILTGLPLISVIADMRIDWEGVREMARWVKDRRPECLPDEYDPSDEDIDDDYCDGPLALPPEAALFPHDLTRGGDGIVNAATGQRFAAGNALTCNELLVELAGRKCYDSFGNKAGRKSNAEYIAHTQEGETPHRSIMYHAKCTFFFAGISRRMSQELMRHYVGADRDQEGNPSQESTRYTQQTGWYVAHPGIVNDPSELERWRESIERSHAEYLAYIERRIAEHTAKFGKTPTGLARKRIYESAIDRLPWSFETSVVWTTNPAAITKLILERDNEASDQEFQRFARCLKVLCVRRWPNLFPRFAREWHGLGLDNPQHVKIALGPWAE